MTISDIRFFLFLLIPLFLFKTSAAQDLSLKINGNVGYLYQYLKGNLVIEGVSDSCNSLVVQLNGDYLSGVDCLYRVHMDTLGVCDLYIYMVNENGNHQLLHKQKIVVKEIPVVTTFACKRVGYMDKKHLSYQRWLTSYANVNNYQIDYQTTRFTIVHQRAGKDIDTIENNQKFFTKATQQLIANTKEGDVLYFKNIYYWDPETQKEKGSNNVEIRVK